MRVLIKDAPDPARHREKKHVVAEGIRPIRDGHSRPVRRHQSATAKQHEGENGGENRPPMAAEREADQALLIASMCLKLHVLGSFFVLGKKVFAQARHAILVGTVIDRRRDREVSVSRRRRHRPFQGVGMPGVGRSFRSPAKVMMTFRKKEKRGEAAVRSHRRWRSDSMAEAASSAHRWADPRCGASCRRARDCASGRRSR